MAFWVDVGVIELSIFLTVTIHMPQVEKHKILEYWFTDPLIETPIFGTTFVRNRYLSLLRYFRFTDNRKTTTNDRFSKLRSIIDDLKKKFSNTIYLYQNLVIDDSRDVQNGHESRLRSRSRVTVTDNN